MAASIWKLDMFGTELLRSIMYEIQFIISFCCEHDTIRHLQGYSIRFVRCLFRLEVTTKIACIVVYNNNTGF